MPRKRTSSYCKVCSGEWPPHVFEEEKRKLRDGNYVSHLSAEPNKKGPVNRLLEKHQKERLVQECFDDQGHLTILCTKHVKEYASIGNERIAELRRVARGEVELQNNQVKKHRPHFMSKTFENSPDKILKLKEWLQRNSRVVLGADGRRTYIMNCYVAKMSWATESFNHHARMDLTEKGFWLILTRLYDDRVLMPHANAPEMCKMCNEFKAESSRLMSKKALSELTPPDSPGAPLLVDLPQHQLDATAADSEYKRLQNIQAYNSVRATWAQHARELSDQTYAENQHIPTQDFV